MEKRTADSPQQRENVATSRGAADLAQDEPRGNQEVDRADLERSTERLEMLLGH